MNLPDWMLDEPEPRIPRLIGCDDGHATVYYSQLLPDCPACVQRVRADLAETLLEKHGIVLTE